MCDHQNICPTCGDRLAHQKNGGPDEASSAYLQHLHDDYPRVMNVVNDDAVIHARSTGILRHLEHKWPGQSLKRSQLDTLPMVAEGIASLISRGRLNPGSGVYVIEIEPPWTRAVATTVFWDGSTGRRRELSGDQLARFETARPLRDDA